MNTTLIVGAAVLFAPFAVHLCVKFPLATLFLFISVLSVYGLFSKAPSTLVLGKGGENMHSAVFHFFFCSFHVLGPFAAFFLQFFFAVISLKKNICGFFEFLFWHSETFFDCVLEKGMFVHFCVHWLPSRELLNTTSRMPILQLNRFAHSGCFDCTHGFRFSLPALNAYCRTNHVVCQPFPPCP